MYKVKLVILASRGSCSGDRRGVCRGQAPRHQRTHFLHPFRPGAPPGRHLHDQPPRQPRAAGRRQSAAPNRRPPASLSMKTRFRGPLVAQTSIGRFAQPCGAEERRGGKFLQLATRRERAARQRTARSVVRRALRVQDQIHSHLVWSLERAEVDAYITSCRCVGAGASDERQCARRPLDKRE